MNAAKYTVHSITETIHSGGAHHGRSGVRLTLGECSSSTEMTATDIAIIINNLSTCPRDRFCYVDAFGIADPANQWTTELQNKLQSHGWYVVLETDGRKKLFPQPDWVCLRPRLGTCNFSKCNEVKFLFPAQDPVTEFWALTNKDDPEVEKNLRDVPCFIHVINPNKEIEKRAVEWVRGNPSWRVFFGDSINISSDKELLENTENFADE